MSETRAGIEMEVFGKDELIAHIASKAKLEKKIAGEVVAETIRAVRDSLAEGKRVVLPDFATMHIAQRSEQIVSDPVTGRQFVAPASRFVSVKPEKSFEKKLTEARIPTILLLVPKKDSFAKVVEFHFSRVGWSVKVVHSTDDCKDAFLESMTFLCIVDYGMPKAENLVQKLKVDRRTSKVPLILLFPEGRDPERADEFRVCGDQHIAEPFEVYSLLVLAEDELARVSSGNGREHIQEVCIQFPTTEDNLDAAGRVVRDLLKDSGMEDEKRVAIDAAFREGMLNAAQHGNRYNSERQIKVLYRLYNDKVMVVVTDEGNGFDHKLYLARSREGSPVAAARERYEQGRLGGLGIMLMSRCTDHIEYNKRGNTVTLVKKL